MKSNTVLPDDYALFLTDLKKRIRGARLSAGQVVNREMILLYWDIGQSIVEKQTRRGWGESVVVTLSRDLRAEFPWTTGFSVQNLWRMRQFFLEHTSPAFLSQAVRVLPHSKGVLRQKEVLSQAVRELVSAVPWGHFVNVLHRITDPVARLYYLRVGKEGIFY